jgi:hypothetical protein
MTAMRFPIPVSYNQVTIFRDGLSRPGLLWDDDHVAQGFAWNEETVAFGVSDTDEACLVDVDIAERMEVSPTAISALAVPFLAKSSRIIVGSVGYGQTFPLVPGSYTLTFETLPPVVVDSEPYDFEFKIRFISNPQPEFAILKQGGEVRSDRILRRDARRA